MVLDPELYTHSVGGWKVFRISVYLSTCVFVYCRIVHMSVSIVALPPHLSVGRNSMGSIPSQISPTSYSSRVFCVFFTAK